MSTAALIKVSGETPFEINLSHDGYPLSVLKVLQKIKGGFQALTPETISDAYMSEYSHLEDRLKARVSTNSRFDYVWEYHINNSGNISIFCYELWSKADKTQPVSPLHSLSTTKDECKSDVAHSIITSVKSLVGLGYTIEQAKELSQIVNIEDITFLTNSCLEDCEILNKADFDKAGLDYDDSEGFYPLTNKEMELVAEDGAWIGGAFWGTLGNTCLFNGKKYICSEIQSYFNDSAEDEPNKDKASLHNYNFLSKLITIAEEVDGHVIWSGDVAFEYPTSDNSNESVGGEYTSYLLIPFDFAFKVALNQKRLKAFLTIADFSDKYFISKTLKTIQTLDTVGKLDEFIYLYDCGYRLAQIESNHIDFDRTFDIESGGFVKLRVTYKIMDATYYAIATYVDGKEIEHDFLKGQPVEETEQVGELVKQLHNAVYNK